MLWLNQTGRGGECLASTLVFAFTNLILHRLTETLEKRKKRLDAVTESNRKRRQKGMQAPKTANQRTVEAKTRDEETRIKLEELIQKQENMLIEGSHIRDEPTKPSEKQANRDIDQDCQDAFDFVVQWMRESLIMCVQSATPTAPSLPLEMTTFTGSIVAGSHKACPLIHGLLSRIFPTSNSCSAMQRRQNITLVLDSPAFALREWTIACKPTLALTLRKMFPLLKSATDAIGVWSRKKSLTGPL